jgi:Tol biopolymer transport system component
VAATQPEPDDHDGEEGGTLMRVRLLMGGVAVLAAVAVVATSVEASAPKVARVSSSAAGVQANGDSSDPKASRDGTWVVFTSEATNLDPRDTQFWTDVYAKNTVTGQVELVSVNMSGTRGNSSSHSPAISADGRYVTFLSNATDLVPKDTNNSGDVFRRDLVNHTTELVSLANDGSQADHISEYPAISGDGRYVAFHSQAQNLLNGIRTPIGFPPPDWQVYLRDMVTGTTVLVSATAAGTAGDASSAVPSISDDGRFVAYSSVATDLVVPDTTPDLWDVYWWDRLHPTQTARVSVNNANVQANDHSQRAAISGDGRHVAFESEATNLGLPNPTGDRTHVYARSITAHTTDRVSMDSNYHAGNDSSGQPSMSYDGRYVAFVSAATNLVPVDGNSVRDIFVRDRLLDTTVRVSVTETGGEANGHSTGAVITADATRVAFRSFATNVVTPDHNGSTPDVFLGPAPGANPPPTPTWSLLPGPTEWRPPRTNSPTLTPVPVTAPPAN